MRKMFVKEFAGLYSRPRTASPMNLFRTLFGVAAKNNHQPKDLRVINSCGGRDLIDLQ